MRRNTFIVVCLLFIAITQSRADLGVSDPFFIGMGARPIAMGRAYIALANDGSAPMTNPGGLGFIDEPKALSMITRIVDAVDYQVVGVVLPWEAMGTLAFGYCNRSIGDISVADASAIVGGRLDRSMLGTGSINDGLIFGSYGLALFEYWSMGFTLKYFYKGSTGTSLLNDYEAHGFDLDIGSIWQLTDTMTIGVALLNILPETGSNFGGIVYKTDTVESVDAIFKVGISNSFFHKQWIAVFDVERNLDQNDFPFLFHAGVEWHPFAYVFFRAGIDQLALASEVDDPGNDVETVPAFGVGLNISGIRFDYTYRQHAEVSALTSHLFSISWVGEEPILKSAEEVVAKQTLLGNLITLESPQDKTTTYESKVTVKGKVRYLNFVQINGEPVKVSDNIFTKVVPLEIGQNEIIATVKDKKKSYVSRARVLRFYHFPDVSQGPYLQSIEILATLGLVGVDGDGLFNPKRPVTRAELADTLVQIKKYKVSQHGAFPENIDVVAQAGLIKGYPDGKLKTTRYLTKAQFAVVLARLEGYVDPVSQKQDEFMRKEHWADPAVNYLARINAYNRDEFVPFKSYVTKEEYAYLLAKTSIVRERVDRLVNFKEDIKSQDISLSPRGQYSSPRKVKYVSPKKTTAAKTGGVQSDWQVFSALTKKPAKTEAPKAKAVPYISIKKPQQGIVLNKNKVAIQGEMRNCKKLFVNGKKIHVKSNGKFYYVLKGLKPGDNSIVLKAVSVKGKEITKIIKVFYKK